MAALGQKQFRKSFLICNSSGVSDRVPQTKPQRQPLDRAQLQLTPRFPSRAEPPARSDGKGFSGLRPRAGAYIAFHVCVPNSSPKLSTQKTRIYQLSMRYPLPAVWVYKGRSSATEEIRHESPFQRAIGRGGIAVSPGTGHNARRSMSPLSKHSITSGCASRS